MPLFLIVTSKGAGLLLPVTLPKSYITGNTPITGLPTVGAGAESPPPLPHAVTAIIMKSIATPTKCFLTIVPFGEVSNCGV